MRMTSLTGKRLWLVALCAVFASGAFAGSPWVKMVSPTSSSLNKVCFIDTSTGWVAGDSGTVLMTTDGGQSWEHQTTGIRDNIIDLFVLDRMNAWAVALHYTQDTVVWYGTVFLRTTNGGTTWTRQNYPDDYFFAVAFLDSVNGWMGGVLGRLLRTSDGGTSWSTAQVDSSMFMEYPVLHMVFYSREYGFAVGGHIDRAGVIWRTTNAGERWAATCPNVGEPLHGLWYLDSLNIIAVGGDFDYGSGMVRSTDGGITWQYTYLGIWGEARAISFRTPAEAFVPLGFAGTYMVTTDTGKTWHDYFTPDSSAVYDVAFPDSLHGYMVGINGTILKYHPGTDDVRPAGPGVPVSPTLFQNFPNPFNPGTTISFTLPHSSDVSVRVFDVLGRKVSTLFQGHQGPGLHEVEFSGDAYPSGVYYYELTTTSSRDRTTQVGKMLLVK